MFKGKALLLAKTESTYGTDANPSASSNAILCEPPELEIIADSLERPNVRTFLGARPRVNVGKGVKIRFVTELKGSGTAGTAPEIGVLFKGCGYTETIQSGVSVTYAPNSNLSAADSLTIWFYYDGMVNKVTGCRGTYAIDLKAGEYGKATWEFTGLWQVAADLSLATGTFNSTVPARFVSASFAIDSYAGIIENVKIDGGNSIAQRRSANAATGILEYFINGRAVTGSVDPEVVPAATKNFWNMFASYSQVAFTATLGGTGGNILTIAGPKVQLSDIRYGDRDGILTYELPVVFTPSIGNDEITFVFT